MALSVVADPLPIYGEVQTKLFPQIRGKVNIDREVTSYDFVSLIAPVKVDFIGKNLVPVAGVTADFSRSENTVTNSLTKFVSLIHALDKDDIKDGNSVSIGKICAKPDS